MTLTNIKRALAFVLVFAVIAGASAFSAFAAENKASHSRSEAQYTNPETGYQVLIKDDKNLLDSAQEAMLVEDMAPLTDYGHAIFWSTDIKNADYIDQARRERLACYDYDSASIFMINMGSRKICIQSYGTLYDSINDSKARSITDNVSKHASAKDYYTCVKEAFGEMYATVNGKQIAEPMKYASYAVIALMLGIILALAIAFSKRFNPLRKSVEPPETTGSGTLMATPLNMVLVRTETIVVESHSSGGFSGGGGGGCGGGGGGGCGGGGGSSF